MKRNVTTIRFRVWGSWGQKQSAASGAHLSLHHKVPFSPASRRKTNRNRGKVFRDGFLRLVCRVVVPARTIGRNNPIFQKAQKETEKKAASRSQVRRLLPSRHLSWETLLRVGNPEFSSMGLVSSDNRGRVSGEDNSYAWSCC